MYGFHPRGILEVKDLSSMTLKSAQGENFVEGIKELHDKVRQTLQQKSE